MAGGEVERFLIVGDGRESAFESVLAEWNIPFFKTGLADFPDVDPSEYGAVLFLPGYFDWDDLAFKHRVVTRLREIFNLNKGFYAEFIQSDDYILTDTFMFKQNYPPRPAALERAFVTSEHYLTQDFALNEILPVRDCAYLPGQKRGEVVLSFGSVMGAREVAYGLPPRHDIWPALLSFDRSAWGEEGRYAGGGWLYASFELSRFREKDFPLQREWEKLLRRVVLFLLSKSRRPEYEAKMPTPVSYGAAGKKTSIPKEKRPQKYGDALDRIIGWYMNSGVMPEADGSRGVYEGFRSVDHKLIPIYRTDCNLDSAMALYAYGEFKDRPEYRDAALNIVDFICNKGWQDTNPEHETYGLWKFYDDYSPCPRLPFCNDNSWAAVDLFSLYHKTGKSEYRERALLTGETQMRLGMEGIICIAGRELNNIGRERYMREIQKKRQINPFVPACYTFAYNATGDARFLDAAERGADELFNFAGRVEHSVFSIYLYAVLYKVTGRDKYLEMLNHDVMRLKRYQLPCGAVKTYCRNEQNTRSLYGLGEVDVVHKAGDRIVDMLYVNAPLAYCLYTAWDATRDGRYLEFFHRIMDFLVDIQIKSPDARIDGAWMRAFDYDRWDYYGSNGDLDWGPYCVESGWTNSWIARSLALSLTNASVI